MSESFFKITSTDDVPEGTVKVFTVSGNRIALCRVENSYYAVADLCSHDGGPLGEGELVGQESGPPQIECPRHGARFDVISGRAMCLPAITPIPIYKVEVRGNEVWASVPAFVPN